MIKNICKLAFRSLYSNEQGFTPVRLAYSGNTLEIQDEDTDAGTLFHHSLRVTLQERIDYRYDGLQFRVDCSDGTCILIGNHDIPAFMKRSQNLDGMTLAVDWSYWIEPVFLPVN